MKTRHLQGVAARFAFMVCAAWAMGSDHSLEHVISGDHRSDENKARDVYRHPLETLNFFGVQEGMTVVEIWPGSGWYTEILAPFLKDHGHYYAAHFSEEMSGPYADYFKKNLAGFKEKVKAESEVLGNVHITEFDPPRKVAIAPAGSADMVLTFRNLHNWMPDEGLPAAFKAFFDALKPGGILGVVEHRTDKEQDPEAKSGYMNRDFVIEAAQKAGFRLEAESEINANHKDDSDHPQGVWTLPPTFALGDKDRDTYAAIGESNRMTLKFVKPR